MKISEVVRHLRLPFLDGSAPLADAIREDDQGKVLHESRQLVLADPENIDAAALHVVAHAFVNSDEPLDTRISRAAARWLRRSDVKSDVRVHMLFGAALADQRPEDLEIVLDQLMQSGDDVAGIVFPLCGFLPIHLRGRVLMAVAQHPVEQVREHLFALLGKHRRLVPPDSIRFDFVPGEIMQAVLAAGIDDTQAKTRERAIAAAYGLGLVPSLREQVLEHLNDSEPNVRQFAIVALGVLQDAESRDTLVHILRTGSKDEMTSALWALARRKDGIDDVLRMAGDARPWVNDEVLGAFAEVSVPLTDEQIANLEHATSSAAFPQLRVRHLERTRHGAPEEGPDGRIDVIVRR